MSMKIGAISDIEGNDSNLEQVLDELEGSGLIINLGDSVGDTLGLRKPVNSMAASIVSLTSSVDMPVHNLQAAR